MLIFLKEMSVNIKPVDFTNHNKIYFKSSFNTNRQIDSSNSKQNNSADFYLDSKFYYNLVCKKYPTMAQKIDILNLDNPNGLTLSSGLKKELSPDKELEIKLFALNQIKQIKQMACIMGLPPSESEDKIPSLVSFSSKDYLKDILAAAKNFERQVEKSNDSPVFFISKINPRNNANVKNSGKNAANDTLLQKAKELKMLYKYLKKNKDELQGALDIYSRALDYKIYRVLMSGFNRDARDIIVTLSDGEILGVKPRLSRGTRGTYFLSYDTSRGSIVVERDNYNSDYISASLKNAPIGQKFSIDFNENGSIRQLLMTDTCTDCKFYVRQNNAAQTAAVTKYYKSDTKTYDLTNKNGTLASDK